MKKENQKHLRLALDANLEEHLAWMFPNHGPYRILKKSIDARSRQGIFVEYQVEVAGPGETLESRRITLAPVKKTPHFRPLIIGTGPAGLFAAMRLAERGVPCDIFERGSQAESRIKGINRFWRYGELDPRDNVCFGEGGAGLYSDGKLITRIKSPHIPYVLQRLTDFGAPVEIEYLANPHVGSDKIRRVIPKLRDQLTQLGCRFFFKTAMRELLTSPQGQIRGIVTEAGERIESPAVVLATGHSAMDVFAHLREQGVHLEGKSFAMGLRIEHPQAWINQVQYREQSNHPALGAANYKLAHTDAKTGIGVYSFCMCPGGFVLSSGTEAQGLVCNGMSNFHRNSPFANAAIVVSVDHTTHFGKDLWGGMKLREQLEQQAYQAVLSAGGKKELPAQHVADFLAEAPSRTLPKGSSPSGVVPVELHRILPSWMRTEIKRGLQQFDDWIEGFSSQANPVFYGVESRTSCPLRITRDPSTLMSLSHPGLYPSGEGAGYAGGITSAACDGIRAAEAILTNEGLQ